MWTATAGLHTNNKINKKKTRKECRCYSDDRFEYLLQLLMPPLLADDLTMENHGGGAQAERPVFPHAALHKRLQVRVQLRKEGAYWSINSINQSSVAQRFYFETNNVMPTGERALCPIDRADEEHDEWSGKTLREPHRDDSLLQRPHYLFSTMLGSWGPLRPADRQLQGATAGERVPSWRQAPASISWKPLNVKKCSSQHLRYLPHHALCSGQRPPPPLPFPNL